MDFLRRLRAVFSGSNKGAHSTDDDQLAELHRQSIANCEAGRWDEAIDRYRRAIALGPASASIHSSLAHACLQLGRIDDGLAALREALRLGSTEPLDAMALANLLVMRGRCDEAIQSLRPALTAHPESPTLHSELGRAYAIKGDLDQAMSSFRQAIELDADFATAHSNLGRALQELGKLSAAIQSLRRAVSLQPELGDAWNNLGNVLNQFGDVQGGLYAYRSALRVNPDDAETHSNLLLSLNYSDAIEPTEIYQEHLNWAKHHAAERPISTFAGSDADRRIRVGYVSPDFRRHSVAFFIEPIIAAHDRDSFEVFCYADVMRRDAVTERIAHLADSWRDIHDLDIGAIDRQIRADQVDILVDLAGHTSGRQMLLFANKPAPVQVSYLGYPNTTGLTALDYRITDQWADPPEQSLAVYTETLLRLPGGFLCYQPPEPCPPVSPAPNRRAGNITFGSFNNPNKLTSKTIAVWAKLLGQCPGARILLKGKQLDDAEYCKQLIARFATHGVAADRLTLLPMTATLTEHLETYHQVDIGLDTFPYGGTTTTCEALWMGVPVITCTGATHASRVGASLLSRCDLQAYIAETPEQYVTIAQRLAEHRDNLDELRAGLRDQVVRAGLTDAEAFCRQLEDTYREIWRRWRG